MEKGEDPKGIAREQRKEGKHTNYREEILEGVRKKIEKEIDKEDRGILNLRKKAQERDTYLNGGAGGEYKAAHREMQERDKERRLEQDGVVGGRLTSCQGPTQSSRPPEEKPRKARRR